VPHSSEIHDPCFVRPVPVAALLDATPGADDAVARALLDKHIPALETALARRADEGKAEGRSEAKADAIVSVLERRGLLVSDELRARVRRCHDEETLDRWLGAAITATSAADALRP
jgi:hypothetical protein